MKKWEILEESRIKNPAKGEARQKRQELRIEKNIEILLKNRRLTSQKEIDEFLHPSLDEITAEKVGIDKKQLKKALTRIKKAMKEKEQIVIFGDYDVDGITATAILWETLNSMSATAIPYIPNRFEEGYGLSVIGITNLESQITNTKLIITVDNGIVANEAVDFANSHGIDVIITDHHTIGEKLPNAHAIVHTTKLCGAGIAYAVAQELRIKNQESRSKEEDNHLELAALGTVADLVPLVGANRAIVKFGIEKLNTTRRFGLLELYKLAGLRSKFGVYEIGYIIGPRLNAAGRIETAMDSLRLLCTRNRERAEELAAKLEIINKERQMLMKESAEHAKLYVKTNQTTIKKILVVSHESYQEGVIGLIAGRLVEEFYRPTIIISKKEKVSKASARSIHGFNIIEFLRGASDFFVNVGGHPMAAGFTVETEKIELLQQTLEQMAENLLNDGHFIRNLRIDCEIPLVSITNTFYNSLQILAPFGMNNPEPVFASKKVTIEDMRLMGKEQQHLRLSVSQENAVFEAVCFGMGELGTKLKIGDKIDIAYTIDENSWNGNTKLQLKVKDIQTLQED